MFLIALIVILLLTSAFFSLSETALIGASRSKLYKFRMEGNKRAEKVAKILERKDRLITTILLGNTAVIIGASSLATEAFIDIFGDKPEIIFYSTGVMTMVILIFSEVLPKVFALKNPEKMAMMVAPFMTFFVKGFSPLTYIVEKIVGLFLRIFGFENKGMEGVVRGLDALRGALELYHDEGDVFKEDKDMLGSILDLDDMEVSDIMQHRRDMEAIDISLSNAEIVAEVLKSQYSRIPVYHEKPDNVIGILYAKSLMKVITENKGDISEVDIKSILAEPWFVPESTTLKDQLIAFRERHQHFALVVDEYGSLLGMITLEDILEEIVGNIEDEYDVNVKKVEMEESGSFLIDAAMPVRDLNREMNWSLPVDSANTVAGMLIAEAQMIPKKGQVFKFFGFRFEVLKKKRNQVTRLKITKLEQ